MKTNVSTLKQGTIVSVRGSVVDIRFTALAPFLGDIDHKQII
ncbi:MAG: hypothetical protein P1U47_04055 [Zhongshania sp.]|nr:hypothetical protein [Zhongshania sp.]MDF1691523.1 hypothetical protein [Zhongshania sp.]